MVKWFVWQTAAIALGFLLDYLIGDPCRIPHPVICIGKCISFFDRRLRRGNSNPKDVPRGALTVLCVVLLSTVIPALLLVGAWLLHPVVYFVLDSLMCGLLLAARQLVREAKKVQRALEVGDTEGARKAVSYIVGRDTDVLDDKGICRAAVETVAENGSDGVIAPLCWMFLFGAVGGFFYKAINTMDSMLGYKNEKYFYFGRAAAKTDDAVNFIPARLSALLMIFVCPLCGLDAKNAWRIFRRDRHKHASPNSAQTEAACAGALRVQLAGDAVYGGVMHKKDFLGDPIKEIEPNDITRAGHMMYAASFVMLLLGLLLRTAVILLCF